MTRRGLLACGLLAMASASFAATPAPAGVRVEHAWIRWLPAGLPNAGYATLVNASAGGVSLTAASSPAYQHVTLHHSRLAEGDSTMVMITHLDVPAHTSIKLAPGGYHLMLAQPTRSLKPGDTVPVTLQFAGGGELQVDFSVLPANASGPAD